MELKRSCHVWDTTFTEWWLQTLLDIPHTLWPPLTSFISTPHYTLPSILAYYIAFHCSSKFVLHAYFILPIRLKQGLPPAILPTTSALCTCLIMRSWLTRRTRTNHFEIFRSCVLLIFSFTTTVRLIFFSPCTTWSFRTELSDSLFP